MPIAKTAVRAARANADALNLVSDAAPLVLGLSPALTAPTGTAPSVDEGVADGAAVSKVGSTVKLCVRG